MILNNSKKGYTLIELMVSIGILALLATATAPAISRTKRQQELQQAGLGLKAEILEAQSLSLAPPKDNDGNQYFGVEIGNGLDDEDGFSYKIVKKPDDTDSISIVDYNTNSTTSFSTVKDTRTSPEPQYVWFKVGNTPTMSLENSDGSSWVDSSSGLGIIDISNTVQNKKININPDTGTINVTDN